MALKINRFISSYGVTYRNLYYRVESVSYDETQKLFQWGGAAYVSEQAAKDGMQPIPGDFQFGDSCYNIDKTANLFELAYNQIKYEAAQIKDKTDEEIMIHNQQRINECVENNEPPTGIWKVDYRPFIDAEDC